MKKMLLWQKYYMCCLICILGTVSIISTAFLTRFWIEKKQIVGENIENVTYFADHEISGKLENIRDVFSSMTVARSLKNSLESGNNYRTKTEQVISLLYADYNEVLSVFFVDRNNNYYSAGEAIGGLDKRLGMIRRSQNSENFSKNKYIWFYAESNPGNNLCVLYQKIINIGDRLEREVLGDILVCIDTEKISDNYFDGMAKDTRVIFLDEYDVIVASAMPEWVGRPFSEIFDVSKNTLTDRAGNTYSYGNNNSAVKGWQCISLTSFDLVMSQTRGMIALVIFIGIICSIVLGLISYRIAYGIGRPISELLNYARVSDTGEVLFDRSVGADEIVELKTLFDRITENLKNETEVRHRKEEQLRIAQIKALEEQVNPHFLYNTLQIIQMLSVIGRTEDIRNVTTYMGKMLRFNLDGRNEVYLGEEIENVENYFKILKYRYGDEFDYNLNIDERLRKYKTIKFLLQPFVENSFKHGFCNKEGLWEIAIIAVEYQEEIAIVIRDNGIGIEAGRLRQLKDMLKGDTAADMQCVGIRNVHERIKFCYGERYGVDIFCLGANTHILIHIPKITDSENEEEINV